VSLSPEQQHAYEGLLANRHRKRIQALAGYAGTGKSHLLTRLTEALPDWTPTAFTGKACHVLRQRGVAARTVHSLIYRLVEIVPDPKKPKVKRLVFELRDTPRGDPGGFLIDESSMIGRELFADLAGYGLPIIAIGDNGQLPPVRDNDAGLLQRPDYVLEELHRNAGPIAFFAEHLRQGGLPHTFSGQGDAVQLVSPRAAPEVDQVLCGFNNTRVSLNRAARERLGRVDDRPVAGDRVICLKNSRSWGLFNGSQAEVLEVDPAADAFDLRCDDGRVRRDVPFDPTVFNVAKPDTNHAPGAALAFDFAWAVTTHKAQGSEWSTVRVVEQHCPYWQPERWSYTAASRAKSKLYWTVGARPVVVSPLKAVSRD
jgi:exodeoxyribonuclease-5